MEEKNQDCRKRIKYSPSAEDIKKWVLDTKEPLVIRNVLSWDLLKWSLQDWVEKLENPTLDVRIGTSQCTKVPQWDSSCEVVSASLKDILDESNDAHNGTWMYFDYKHIKMHFGKKIELFESITWADFGFPDKNEKDSTIWIGTKGAYTPCHMDTYGCNIVGQVYGRKQWVMFPPSATSVLRPTRVPYEESSIYSDIHFGCGLNVTDSVGEARVVELSPGDVLVVPSHWWHYVENMTSAISINMWIPKECDHSSRLEESLVRYFVGLTLNNLGVEEGTPFLNPNEMDLLADPVDLRQISWCLEQVMTRQKNQDAETEKVPDFNHHPTISVVPSLKPKEIRQLLLNKCGCVEKQEQSTETPKLPNLSQEDVINAFCHPDVIAKVAEKLLSFKK